MIDKKAPKFEIGERTRKALDAVLLSQGFANTVSVDFCYNNLLFGVAKCIC